MNAPILWIAVPGVLSAVLLLIRNHQRLSQRVAVGVTAVLAAAAVILPIGGDFSAGPVRFELATTFQVLGRLFVLNQSDKTFLALVYALSAFWFLGAGVARAPRWFFSLGLAIVAILVASMAVEPFLYAALLVEMAVLISIPLLTSAGKRPGPGIMRYLIFQTLGMPFILLAGWVLGSVEASPSRELLLQQASVFLGLGFAFWLAVFPFYSWIPLLADEAHPYLAGFIFSLLPTVVLFLGLDFVNGFTWLRGSAILYQVLQLAGVMMVVTSGIWAAFQQDMNRLFGYMVIFETGFSLLAISTRQAAGLEVFATAFLPRLLTLGVGALALTILQSHEVSLRVSEMRGLISRFPFASAALTMVFFSTGALPLMASFPIRIGLLSLLAQQNMAYAVWALVAGGGFLFSGLRLLHGLVWGVRFTWTSEETRWQRFFLAAGLLALILIGWFPQAAFQSMLPILQAFPNLYP